MISTAKSTRYLSTLFTVGASLVIACAFGCSSKPKAADQTAATPAAQTNRGTEATSAHDTSATSPAAKSTAKDEVVCTQGKETRSLRVASSGAKGCELIYKKTGETHSIASSSNSMNHCKDVRGKVVKNLEKSGYSCH